MTDSWSFTLLFFLSVVPTCGGKGLAYMCVNTTACTFKAQPCLLQTAVPRPPSALKPRVHTPAVEPTLRRPNLGKRPLRWWV